MVSRTNKIIKMKKEEILVPESLFLNEHRKASRLQSKIYFQETFIEYIKENNLDLYDKAMKYTNELKSNNYFTEEEKLKWKMK